MTRYKDGNNETKIVTSGYAIRPSDFSILRSYRFTPTRFSLEMFAIEFLNNPHCCIIRRHINDAMTLGHTRSVSVGNKACARIPPRAGPAGQANPMANLITAKELSARPGYSWIPSWTFSQPSFPSASWRVSFYLPCYFFVLST